MARMINALIIDDSRTTRALIIKCLRETRLAASEIAVDISLPTVIGASSFKILVQRRVKSTADYVYFDSPYGKLWTAVTVGVHSGIIL